MGDDGRDDDKGEYWPVVVVGEAMESWISLAVSK